MGLDTTHGCWHGPYSSFDRWRTMLAQVAGFPPLNSMQGFGGKHSWDDLQRDALTKLLNHSDCDGKLDAVDCGPIADRLTELIPLLPSADNDYWREKTQAFIDGLRKAAAAGEDVEFH